MSLFGEQKTQKQVLFDRVVEYLESQNWKYSIIGDDNSKAKFGLSLKGKISSCDIIVAARDREIEVYGFVPIKATPDCFNNVVEYITRANYGLKVGAFEFDYSDGEIRYHTCLVCSEGIPSLKDVERVVDLPALMVQRYGDGLAKNLMGFGSPEADIREAEGE